MYREGPPTNVRLVEHKLKDCFLLSNLFAVEIVKAEDQFDLSMALFLVMSFSYGLMEK